LVTVRHVINFAKIYAWRIFSEVFLCFK